MLAQLVDASLSVGSTQLLEGANATLVRGHRVALVGANGCGKSTLLRAIAGVETGGAFCVGAGSISRSGSALLVEQDRLAWEELLPGCDPDEMTIFDAVELSACDPETADDEESWRRLYVSAKDRLGWAAAGYESTPLARLSQGSAVRAFLAVALHRPGVDLLLLDEPTNHLDLPSILWLARAIVALDRTVVVVSHDERFLEDVCTHTWAVSGGEQSLTASGASYAAFRRAEAVAREQQAAAYEAQQRRNKRLTAASARLRDASAAGAKAEARDNDKLQRDFRRDRAGRSGRKAKAVERLRDSQAVVERPAEHRALHIDIEPLDAGAANSRIVLSDVELAFGSVPPVSLHVGFGERVAIVGFNGVGKSTLVKTLTGALAPAAGSVSVGGALRLGHLTQAHEGLPRHLTPREHFAELSGLSAFDAGQAVMKYGVTFQQVDRPIGELNPGARARTLLAGFAALRVNALVLDEPTNHLDEEAVREVTASLNVFAGTAVVVSHSRSFLEAVEFTAVYRLSRGGGLERIESVGEFVREVEAAVEAVV